MRKSKFTVEEKQKILDDFKQGLKLEQICLQYQISVATFYRWQSQFEGLNLDEVKNIQALKQEIYILRNKIFQLNVEVHVLKDLLEKKV